MLSSIKKTIPEIKLEVKKMKMTKELWRTNWLRCINELTSIELQINSWLDKSNTNPHWSFVEFISCYFDDLLIQNNYEKELKDKWISKEEYLIIIKWHDKIGKYESPKNDDYNVAEILDDEKWKQIVEEGNSIKKELEKLLNKTEADVLNEKIDYSKYF